MFPTSIKRKSFSGTVYNFTVNETHLYVVNGMVVSNCHENSMVNGKHGDLNALEPMIATLHAGTECSVGGGNALAHPDLVWFLERLKEVRRNQG